MSCEFPDQTNFSSGPVFVTSTGVAMAMTTSCWLWIRLRHKLSNAQYNFVNIICTR
jgi:hypothetical protein